MSLLSTFYVYVKSAYVLSMFCLYLQVHQSVLLYRQVGHIESFCPQNSAGVQNTFMFRLSGDDMALFSLIEPAHALWGGGDRVTTKKQQNM